MVHEFNDEDPVSQCEHTSGLDSHYNRYRYPWLVSVNGRPALPGMGVTHLYGGGKIVPVNGFLDLYQRNNQNIVWSLFLISKATNLKKKYKIKSGECLYPILDH